MTSIFHSHTFTTAVRTSESRLVSECVLVSSSYEATATMLVAVDSFRIQEAHWEIYRSPGSQLNGSRKVDCLCGVEAYLRAGEALREIGRTEGEIPCELLTECVKATIQAETYLFKERGYSSGEVYDAYWKERYLNSCRLYSNLDRVSHNWYKHVATRMWGVSLLNRFKNSTVERADEGSLRVRGSFMDSFHEINACMTVNNGIISTCSGSFLRAPDLVCWENTEHFSLMEGTFIDGLTVREIRNKVGGSQGCSHIVDLLNYLLGSLQQR